MTVQKFYVRPVVPEDKKHTPYVYKLINDAYNSTETWTSTIHIVDGDRITPQLLDDIIDQNGNSSVLLYAFDQDKAIGVISVASVKEDPGDALLSMLAVSPEYQSRGIGGLLMREAIEQVYRIGLKTPVVHVLKCRTELLEWYSKLGFKEVGIEHDFIYPDMLKIQGDGTKNVVMKK